MRRSKKELTNRITRNDGVRRYLAGQSSYTIAKDVGVSPATVRRYLQAQGVKIRSHKETSAVTNKTHVGHLTIRKCIEHYNRGLSLRTVALEAGVSHSTIRNVLAKYGVTIRGKGKIPGQRPAVRTAKKIRPGVFCKLHSRKHKKTSPRPVEVHEAIEVATRKFEIIDLPPRVEGGLRWTVG